MPTCATDTGQPNGCKIPNGRNSPLHCAAVCYGLNPDFNYLGVEYGSQCYCGIGAGNVPVGKTCPTASRLHAQNQTRMKSVHPPSISLAPAPSMPGDTESNPSPPAFCHNNKCGGCVTPCQSDHSITCGGSFAQNQYLFSCSEQAYVCNAAEKKCEQSENGTFSHHGCLALCDGGIPPQMQWGEVFLLVTFCGVFAPYLVLGVLFQKYRRHESGFDLLPNRGFWSSLPGLVEDGVRHSLGCIGRKAGVQIAASYGSYEDL